MNKKKFLSQLEQKLKVLSKEEIQDILNEYEDIIDEKVKHGKTEEEAVLEFGDISSLSKEILKSYKIDPEYQKSNNDFLGDCEDLIKKGAKKLTEVTEEVVNTFKKNENELTLETVFEIILKVCLVLLIIAFIHIPFWIIGEIGESFFESNFMFFGSLFGHSIFALLWKLLTEAAYIIVCILLVVAVFKKYTVSKVENKEKIEEAKKEVKKVNKKTTDIKEEQVKEEKIVKKENKSTNTLSNILVIIIKIWIAIIFILPLAMMQIGIIIGICVLIYLIVKKVEVYALLVLVVGVSLFVGHLIHILSQALFTKQRIHFWPFVPSFIMIILGGIFTIDYFFSFSYTENIEAAGYKLNTSKYEYIIDRNVEINHDEIFIDNNMEDGKVIVEISYYDKLVEIELDKYETEHCLDDSCKPVEAIHFYSNLKEKKSINAIIDDTVLKNLRDKTLVDYSRLFDLDVKVITNSNTAKKVY